MRYAAIDIQGEILAEAARTLRNAGLKIEGSLVNGFGALPGAVRLVVRDELGSLLPVECETPFRGWWLVRGTIVQEWYGLQHMDKLGSLELIGRIVFDDEGRSSVEYLERRPASPSAEEEAAKARADAILSRTAGNA